MNKAIRALIDTTIIFGVITTFLACVAVIALSVINQYYFFAFLCLFFAVWFAVYLTD